MFRMTPSNIGWLVGYIVMLAAIVVGLGSYRESAMASYSTKTARTKWQDWRNAAGEIGKDGPVEREMPKSVEPPPLVLMRDHFAACLGISLLLSSCLYVWFMFCARGALRPVELNTDVE